MLYFDNAATTQISPQSLSAYVNASKVFYNPSALYGNAFESKTIIENARKYFLSYFSAPNKSTFIFTGSATESNNAVLNACITRKDKKYIISAGEHSSIYVTAKHYAELGYNVVFVPLNNNGQVNEEILLNEVDATTAFVSIIHVSNETGAINNIEQITKQIKAKNSNVLVHSDGVQAVGKLKINLKNMGVDFYTISAHKINGPKGIGALFIANPNKFKPFVLGGGQEMNLRSGTENLPQIEAFKVALQNCKQIDYSLQKQAILSNLSGDFILMSHNNCVENIISICFKNVRGETILHMLEAKGYLIGTGSACNSKAGVNRVLSPIVPKEYIEGAIRISFGEEITVEDCKNLAIELSNAVKEYINKIHKDK